MTTTENFDKPTNLAARTIDELGLSKSCGGDGENHARCRMSQRKKPSRENAKNRPSPIGGSAGADQLPTNGFKDPIASKLAEIPSHDKQPKLRHLGGSASDDFNVGIGNAVLKSCWITSRDPEDQMKIVKAIGWALAGIDPKDELEGLLAAQMVAAHNASMECSRRAMIPEQSAEGRAMNLSQANKASRTFATLLDALNRHRSKGQQRVVVEHVHRHVHVHENGRTIDGYTGDTGGGGQIEKASQSHAKQAVEYALEPALRSENAEREPVLRAGNGERPMPTARRNKSRSAEGEG